VISHRRFVALVSFVAFTFGVSIATAAELIVYLRRGTTLADEWDIHRGIVKLQDKLHEIYQNIGST